MKTFARTLAVVGIAGLALAARPAQAQLSVGISAPGFSVGVGPAAGYVGGGYYPAYPVAVPPPVYYAPRPSFYAPPLYGPAVYPRPYYGGRPPYYGGGGHAAHEYYEHRRGGYPGGGYPGGGYYHR